MSSTLLKAAQRAVTDVVANFYAAQSPYGPGWQPCDSLNGKWAGTPIAATLALASGSTSVTIVTGALYPNQPLSGPGLAAGTTVVSANYSTNPATAVLSQVATATLTVDVRLVRPRDGNLWMTCLAVNMDYCHWQFLGDANAKQRIVDMAPYLLSTGGYSEFELGSDGSTDGSISLLDDAALKARMLEQIYAATGNQPYLTALITMVPAVLRRFNGGRDTSHRIYIYNDDGTPALDPYGFQIYYWDHGACYDANSSNPNYHKNNLHEAVLALSALSIYDKFGGSKAYYKYAYATYFRMITDYSPKSSQPNDPNNPHNVGQPEPAYGSGNFYAEYDFILGTSAQWYFGYPAVGACSLDVNLSLTLALLAKRLSQLSITSSADKALFEADIKAIVTAIQKQQASFGFLTSSYDPSNNGTVATTGIFLPWADSWTDTANLASFAALILNDTASGYDPSRTCASIVAKTAAYALKTRKSNNTYTSDWAGDLSKPVGYGGLIPGERSYEAFYTAHPGSTYDSVAGSPQIMTNALAAVAGIAGAVIEASGLTIPNYGIPVAQLTEGSAVLTDPATGQILIDE